MTPEKDPIVAVAALLDLLTSLGVSKASTVYMGSHEIERYLRYRR